MAAPLFCRNPEAGSYRLPRSPGSNCRTIAHADTIARHRRYGLERLRLRAAIELADSGTVLVIAKVSSIASTSEALGEAVVTVLGAETVGQR